MPGEPANAHFDSRGRREFLRQLGAGAISLALAKTGLAAEAKPLRGLFPIG
jgi:hypothetical protein